MSMEPETCYGMWWKAETTHGLFYVPADEIGEAELPDCVEGEILACEQIGPMWAARLSMPGHLDCTDWTGLHETEADALAELRETYGLDEDEDAPATTRTVVLRTVDRETGETNDAYEQTSSAGETLGEQIDRMSRSFFARGQRIVRIDVTEG